MNFYLLHSFVKKSKMKTFKDLEFEILTDEFMSGKKGRIQFDNKFGASVVSHTYSYGGKQDELHYDNPVAQGDVRGYLSEEEVTDLLIEIQKL
jgi:hypothetical protein